VPCNTCRYCLSGNHTVCETLRKTNFEPGGFAECVRLPAINVDRGVFLLPAKMSYEEATFIEPLACVLRGQKRANFQSGNSVLVIGSGIAGLLHIRLARALGARFIAATDISEYRLEAARWSGADLAVQAKEDIPLLLRQTNDGRLADIVIVCNRDNRYCPGFSPVERGALFFCSD
jgi:L-iditol 2-dehydrogenase